MLAFVFWIHSFFIHHQLLDWVLSLCCFITEHQTSTFGMYSFMLIVFWAKQTYQSPSFCRIAMLAGWKTYIFVTDTWLLIPLQKRSNLAIDFRQPSPQQYSMINPLDILPVIQVPYADLACRQLGINFSWLKSSPERISETVHMEVPI